jgi:hypothetical protein
MADRQNTNDRTQGTLADATRDGTAAAPPRRTERPISALEANPRRPASKFGAAADGWDAYNSWLDSVRQPTPPSRQAVIAKSLYSVSSYKNWADKARGAFEPSAPATAAATGAGKAK